MASAQLHPIPRKMSNYNSLVESGVHRILDNGLIDWISNGLFQIIPKKFIEEDAMQYVAGTTLNEALVKAQEYKERGVGGIFDILGENLIDIGTSNKTNDEYISILRAIRKRNLNARITFKITILGFDVDRDQFSKNLETLVDKVGTDRFEIDAEESRYTDNQLAIYDNLKGRNKAVKLCIQANLKRSYGDVEMRPGGSFRLVKGIYIKEPNSFKKRDEISSNYKKLLRLTAETECHVAIATHDKKLIDYAFKLIEEGTLAPDKFEFQMLHGVNRLVHAESKYGSVEILDYVARRLKDCSSLTSTLDHDNLPLCIYLPYGELWHPYCKRRFKENPHVAGEVLRRKITHLLQHAN